MVDEPKNTLAIIRLSVLECCHGDHSRTVTKLSPAGGVRCFDGRILKDEALSQVGGIAYLKRDSYNDVDAPVEHFPPQPKPRPTNDLHRIYVSRSLTPGGITTINTIDNYYYTTLLRINLPRERLVLDRG